MGGGKNSAKVAEHGRGRPRLHRFQSGRVGGGENSAKVAEHGRGRPRLHRFQSAYSIS
ncbi:MAG: hypothetical protein DMG46_22190 [Acidobacteria bacterium]|nr:MAG: hypothetical protein DMG46_22190 [Acidobacteriota bacterium]